MKIFLVFTAQFLVDMCSAKMNVLLVISDDMRPALNFLSDKDFPTPIHPKMHTPNLDKLAHKSLVLTRSYVQQPLCGPSRTSFLTGRRPDTTGIHGNGGSFRQFGGDYITLPQFFKNNKYVSISIGKVFHPRHNMSDPISFTKPPANIRHGNMGGNGSSWRSISEKELEEHGPLMDQLIAKRATDTLHELAPKANNGEQLFCLAVGFHRPHLPFVFPEEFLEYYPYENIQLPNNQFVPDDMPEIAWSGCRNMGDPSIGHIHTGKFNTKLPDQVVKNMRRAYYACVSYIDALVGELLQALDDLKLAKDTIVVFMGDHGWHLGEHNIWAKNTNFDLATNAPLMIHIPGKTDGGIVRRNLAEFVDIMPTVIEAAGFDPLPLCPSKSNNVRLCREGSSLMTLINNPSGKGWKNAAFSQVKRTKDGVTIMGYTMRTDLYRYTEWPEFTSEPHWHKLHGVELYDHQKDPEENVNVAKKKEYKAIVEELSKKLHAGWRPEQVP